MALTSMVLAIAAWPAAGIIGALVGASGDSIVGSVMTVPLLLGGLVTSVVLAHISLRQLRTTGHRGRGFAIAGMSIGYSLLGVLLLVSIMTLSVVG